MSPRMEACLGQGKKKKEKGKRGWAGWLPFLLPFLLALALVNGCSEPNTQQLASHQDRAANAAVPPGPFPLPAADPSGPDLPRNLDGNKEPIMPASAAPVTNAPPEPAVFRSEQLTTDPDTKLRELHRLAAQCYARIDSYIVRLRRREQVNGKDKPEELLLCRFRKQPFSVYFKWIGPEGNGREVVYVQGRHDNKIHTRMAAGDIPLMPAGKRMALSPDSVLVRSASRHSITEAGGGHPIDLLGQRRAAQASFKYLGLVRRDEFKQPVEGAEESVPPGAEPTLPRGGRRLWFFDPASHLPVLIVFNDDTGHEVEYNCYDLFQYPVKLDD